MKKYIDESQKGVRDGVVPLNKSTKIEAAYLPNYTDVGYMPSDDAASLKLKQTWSHEQTFNYDDYDLTLYDNIAGIAAGFKAPRGMFNQLFVDDIVFTASDNTSVNTTTKSVMNEGISFYVWDTAKSVAAEKDTEGNITTDGYSKLINYRKIFSILNDGSFVMSSPSGKFFKVSVDDNGNLSTTPYTFKETERYEQEEVPADV